MQFDLRSCRQEYWSSPVDCESTVFIADDDPAVCQSIRWLIESVGLDVETFISGQSFLDEVDPARLGCLVLDVRMPGMSGLDLLARMKTLAYTLPVIVLTGYGDVNMAVIAMKRGVLDFIEKPFNQQALLDSVQNAIQRDQRYRSERSDRVEIALRAGRLTPRERQVMDLVVTGLANKEVAAQLGCSGKTVEVHRARVMEKMQASSLAALVRMAITLEREPSETLTR